MSEYKYTDEEIRSEVKELASSHLTRKCCQCANRNPSCTRCKELGIPISRYMYAGHCRFYITDEEKLVEDAKREMAIKDRYNKKQDRLLTMSFTSAEMSIVYLEDFEARIDAEFKRAVTRLEAKLKKGEKLNEFDEAYLKDKKKEHKRVKDYIESTINALKKMDFHLKEARKHFTHYVEPKLNKAFFNEDHTAFNDKDYDNHAQDVFEMCEVNLKYFDATYMNEENGKSVINHIDSLQADRVMSADDYKRYNYRK